MLPDGDVAEAVIAAWQGEEAAFICLLQGDAYAHALIDLRLIGDADPVPWLRAELAIYYEAMQRLKAKRGRGT